MKSAKPARAASARTPGRAKQTGPMAQAAKNSAAAKSLSALQRRADQSISVQQMPLHSVAQRMENKEMQGKFIQRMGEEEPMQGKAIQRNEVSAPNKTGLPDKLKAGIESLSGMSMDHVRVHRNSDKPAAVQAHAYAQGSDIHLGPGQEKHLPHEAWHVVQQAQGRVKPTMQMKGIAVNDDAGLEAEADTMGAKALMQGKAKSGMRPAMRVAQMRGSTALQRAALDAGKLNLVGESHNKNAKRRAAEKAYGERTGGGTTWKEKDFTYGTNNKRGDPDNLIIGYRIDRFKRHIDDLASGYSINDVKGMLTYCKRLPKDLNNVNKFPHQDKKDKLLGSIASLKGFAESLKLTWDTDHSDLDAWKSAVSKKLLFIRPQFQQLNKAYEAITKRSTERDAIDSRYARSDAMWIGAAKTSKTGLWLVGQNHIDDINMLHAKYKGEGTYKDLRDKFDNSVKMQNMGDFNTQFQIWWTTNVAEFPK